MGGCIAVAGREIDLILLVALTRASSDSCAEVDGGVSGCEVDPVRLVARVGVFFASWVAVGVVDSNLLADSDTASRQVDSVVLVALVGVSFPSCA